MKFVGIVLVMIALLIAGLSAYLAPDGLDQCADRPSSKPDCGKVDAVIAVSGGDTTARTAEAIRLYEQGWAEWLVFSGAALDKSGPSNAEAMRRQAIAAGVPNGAILVDETSETTKQNAENVRDLFDRNDIQAAILVTSAYHQRRAGLEFGKRAGTDIRIINHPVTEDNQWSRWWWLSPSGWYLAVGEFVKIMLFYAGGTR